MNYYYIRHFASYRGKTNKELGVCLTGSDNEMTVKNVISATVTMFRNIYLEKVNKMASLFDVSPEWFYFAPVLFSAADFYNLWNDYLIKKSVPLVEQGKTGYEFVIGENKHLPEWFDAYFAKKEQYLNKEIRKVEWFDWAYSSLKPMPSNLEYENNSGEVIRRFMRLKNLEMPSISDAICEELFDNPTHKKKSQFLRTFKTALNTDTVQKRMLIAFSDLTGIQPDVCFS